MSIMFCYKGLPCCFCRDALIVCFGDSLTCIFAGFVIFSYLGHMASKLGVHVKDVATDGKLDMLCETAIGEKEGFKKCLVMF